MPLVSAETYLASLYYDEKRMAGVTEEQIDSALAVAEAAFMRRTNRERLGYWIEAREKTVLLDGTGLPEVRCPYPVLELVSVTLGGEDITSLVRTKGGHFIYRTDGDTFGEKPDSLGETVFCDIELTAKFGDPRIERGDELAPVVPADITECIMRMAWHAFRKERVVLDVANARRSPSDTAQAADLAHDKLVDQVIRDYSVWDSTKTFDFR